MILQRLFTLKSEKSSWVSKQLEEAPGVEFPDISSIDGYLRHWGNHECIALKTLYTWTNDKGEPIIKPGDRVLLVYVPGLEFLDAFFGCLRARIIPVPAIPPDPSQTGGQSLLHIENIAKRTKAVAILSTFGYHVFVKANSAKHKIMLTGKRKSMASWPNLPWLHTDSWIKNSKGCKISYDDIRILINESRVLPKDLCFLQFTSGSTGDAKGVMITNSGLTHNVKLMRKVYKSTSKMVGVSWLPQYHDMGLIGGLLTTLVSGGTMILFSPITFIKNPLLWLQTMSRYHATHSAGPNFAFELLIRRLLAKKEKAMNFDLSSMVFLMVAAEPVRSKTLKSAFGHGEPIFQDWQGRICCGYVSPNDADVDIKIINPETCEENLKCGEEGEVWISSPSAGVGYWGLEDLSEKTFQNTLYGHNGKQYLRSVPEEILLAKGITIPEQSDQVGLVVIAEVRGSKHVLNEVMERIQTVVAEEHCVTIASIVLIKERSISKTTS
nr:acyl carrier protein-like protein [Tanacetum cinerariifolium]